MTTLMTVEQLAQYLNLSAGTVYRLTSTKKIPHIKIGSSVRFKPEVIEHWIKCRTNLDMPVGRN